MNRLGGWHQPGLTEETSDWLGHAPELATFCLNCFSSVSSLPPAREGFPPGQGQSPQGQMCTGQQPGKMQRESAPRGIPLPPGPEAARIFQKYNLALISLCALTHTSSLPVTPCLST